MKSEQFNAARGATLKQPLWIALAALVLLLGIAGVFAWQRWGRSGAADPGKGQNLLGSSIFEQAKKEEAAGQLEQAKLHYEEARKQFNSVLEKWPNDPTANFNLGALSSKQGKISEAEAYFRRSLIGAPGDAVAHADLGSVLMTAGKTAEAQAELETAVKLNPKNASAQYHLATVLLNQGRISEAIEHYQLELAVAPNDGMGQYNLGMALLATNQVEEAIKHFTASANVMPSNAMVHCGLGNALLQKGRLSEAIGEFQFALKLQPNLPFAVSRLGGIAWTLSTDPDPRYRNGVLAVSLAQQAVRATQGQDPLILVQMAAALAEVGNYPQAVSTAERALQVCADQNKPGLAEQVRAELEFYRKDQPFHVGSPETNAPPAAGVK